MAIPKKVLNIFFASKMKHEILQHKTVFTAFDKAMTLSVKPAQVVKTLVVALDRGYAIVAVPANRNLDFSALKKAVNVMLKKMKSKSVKKVGIVKEKWIAKNLKGVKPGAVPPFGVLWNLPTFVDKGFLKEKKIIVNGGSHTESIRMNLKDFLKAVPDIIVGSFSKARK